MPSVEEFKRAWREMEIEEAKRDFIAHLAAYLIVNIFIAVFNLITSPGVLWFHWLVLGWGVGLAFHFVFSRERFVAHQWETKAGRVEIRASGKLKRK
ncbi:MAG: 2TM domain-containing protein [Candidatus Hadarchaeales archaeon]